MSSIPANFTDAVFTIADGAGHSAPLSLGQGDINIGPLGQDGKEVEVYQSRGANVGARLGARKEIAFSGSAILTGPRDAFMQLAAGQTAGYVSVTADLGDAKGVDWQLDYSYGAELRQLYGDDMIIKDLQFAEGSPSTVSYSGVILGPIYGKDASGTTTYVSAR